MMDAFNGTAIDLKTLKHSIAACVLAKYSQCESFKNFANEINFFVPQRSLIKFFYSLLYFVLAIHVFKILPFIENFFHISKSFSSFFQLLFFFIINNFFFWINGFVQSWFTSFFIRILGFTKVNEKWIIWTEHEVL